MRIAFWSNIREECCVTTNMACIAAVTSIMWNEKVAMLANHYKRSGGLGDIIMNEHEYIRKREPGGLYPDNGLDYILKGLYAGADGAELIKSVAVPIFYSNMYYLPHGTIFNKEVFNYDFSLVYGKLFKSLDDFAEFVFVDTETNQNLSSKLILHSSDLIVVNISQNPFLIRDFFDNYSSLKDKVVFLVGSYQPEFTWSYSRICYEYNIPRNRIGVIPYNMELKDAMQSGKVLQFINRNFYKPSGREISYFMRKCRDAASMIRKNMVKIRKQSIDICNREFIDRVCQTASYMENMQ